MPKVNIGFVMACFGAADALGSFIFGKLVDKIGRKPVIFVGTALVLLSTALLNCFEMKHIVKEMFYLFYICAILNGFADACFYSSIYETVGNLFKENVEAAFAGAFFIDLADLNQFFFL